MSSAMILAKLSGMPMSTEASSVTPPASSKGAKVIVEGAFSFAPDSNMPQAAAKIVAAAKKLYGADAQKKVRAAFHARGIL